MGKEKKRRNGGTAPKHLALDPESMTLLRLVEAEKYGEIETAARRLLAKRPGHSLAMKALGFALIGTSRYEEALPVIEAAIARSPNDPELHNNRGIVLSMQMRWDESTASFKRSLVLHPDDPETLKNLGVAYLRMHRWNDAVPPLLRAIECYDGDFVEAISMLADALFSANRVEEAWACFNELHQGNPDDLGVLSQLLAVNLKRCEWSEFRKHLSAMREKSADFSVLSGNPFVPLAWPGLTSAELKSIAHHYLRSQIRPPFLEADDNDYGRLRAEQPKRLRVGYFSADLRDHPVGQVISELIERHDRQRVEVIGYSLGADDGSEVRRRLQAAFDRFVDLSGVGVVETAKRIRQDDVHILIDLHGWTAEGRPEALALRCAPIQANWLGFAGTIGHEKLADYLIGDPVVTPFESAQFYSETLANLPWSYMPVDTRTLPGVMPTREQAGLPESAFVYCSFNNSYKYNPDVFDLWSRILRETLDSCLWLGAAGGDAKTRLAQEMVARGVAAERLIFAPRVADKVGHLARMQLADLALDPFPYNSHSTGGDALLAGVPMVALLGETFAGRVGASLLRAARLDSLIAHTPDEYAEIAIRLCQDREQLGRYRAHLGSRQALPVFDMAAMAGALEDLYFRMWEDYTEGVRRPLGSGLSEC